MSLLDALVHVIIEVESCGCPKSGVHPSGTYYIHAVHMDSNVSVSPQAIEPEHDNIWKMLFHR